MSSEISELKERLKKLEIRVVGVSSEKQETVGKVEEQVAYFEKPIPEQVAELQEKVKKLEIQVETLIRLHPAPMIWFLPQQLKEDSK